MHLKTIEPSFGARGKKGQSLVEFALIVPALLIVIVSIIDFSRLMFTISSVSSASRDAARYGAAVGTNLDGVAHYQDCAGIRGTVERLSYFLEVDIVIEFDADGPGGALPVEYCSPGMDSDLTIDATLGSQIVVGATGDFSSLVLTGLLNLPEIPVVSESRRTILRDIFID